MVPQKRSIVTVVALVGTAMVPGAVSAQVPQREPENVAAPDSLLPGATITLKVDGMSCPFCAYGLEKRLRKLAAVDSVLIRVSDGLVQIRVKEGQQLTDEALREAVKRAGFSLREIHRVKSA